MSIQNTSDEMLDHPTKKVKPQRSRRQERNAVKLSEDYLGDIYLSDDDKSQIINANKTPLNTKTLRKILSALAEVQNEDFVRDNYALYVENDQLICRFPGTGVEVSIALDWFSGEIEILKERPTFRKSKTGNTLYCRKITVLKFKNGVLIRQKDQTQQFEYPQSHLGRPLRSYIRS